jgi:hypothetical protein
VGEPDEGDEPGPLIKRGEFAAKRGKIYPLEVPQKRGRLDDSIRRVVFGIVSLLPMHECEK